MPKKLLKERMTSFQKKVYEIVKRIPQGKVLSYGEVAGLAGYPKAWRAVGNALNKSAPPAGGRRTKIPCHRIIKSDGKIGGYRYGAKRKASLLKKEGIMIKNGKITPRLTK